MDQPFSDPAPPIPIPIPIPILKELAGLLGSGFAVKTFAKPGFGVHRPAKKYDKTKEYLDALAFKPDIVICNLGINDITQWGSYTRDDFVTEFRNLIDAFASLPTHPYILQWHQLAPLFPGQKFHGDPNVGTLNNWLGHAAAHTGVDTIDMFAPLMDHPDWFPDHIHPDEAGSRAIAEAIHRRLTLVD